MKFKIIIFVFYLMFSSFCLAKWQVVKNKSGEYKINNGKNHSFPIHWSSGRPHFIKIENRDSISPYQLVIYYSGSAGTKYIVDETRAIIYHPKTGKSYGDYSWEYKSTNKKIIPPRWKFSKNKIKIVDKEAGIDKTITLP